MWVERPDPAHVAAADAERARYTAEFGSESPVAANWCSAGLVLRALAGDNATATRLLADPVLDNPATLPRDYTWRFTLACLAYSAARMRDEERAAKLRDLLAPSARYGVVRGGGVTFFGSASYWLGMLDTLLGRHADAEAHLAAALAFHERLGAPPWIARTRYEQAKLLIARGDHVAAGPLLAEAGHAADTLGMPALAADVAALNGS